MKILLLSITLFCSVIITKAQGTIAIPITTNIFYGDLDEWIHLRITDTLTNQIWYDTVATVTVSNGFMDTVYLDSATYKCEILDMGANVSMPDIILGDNCIAQYGYPDYQYYLFTIPDGCLGFTKVNHESKIKLYPNPVVDNILTINISDNSKSGTITIIDNIGKIIFVKEFNNENIITLNTSMLSTGFYLLRVDSNNFHETIQFSKTSY
jgi:hypothetical protein